MKNHQQHPNQHKIQIILKYISNSSSVQTFQAMRATNSCILRSKSVDVQEKLSSKIAMTCFEEYSQHLSKFYLTVELVPPNDDYATESFCVERGLTRG